MSNLGQPIPPIQMPMVDASGAPTPAWIQFFANILTRTGGVAGPTAPYTGEIDPATAAALASLSSTVSSYSGQITTAEGAASDAETLSLFGDDAGTAQSIDQSVLLSQVLADA